MRVVDDFFERPSGQFVDVRAGLAHPKPLLRCEDHQRGLPLAVYLPAEQMEVLRSCRCVAQLDVVFGRQNKEAFNSRRGMFWSLTFVTVREEEHESVLLVPFVFSCDEILIDHDLGTVDEVAKLRLPHHER